MCIPSGLGWATTLGTELCVFQAERCVAPRIYYCFKSLSLFAGDHLQKCKKLPSSQDLVIFYKQLPCFLGNCKVVFYFIKK